MFFFLFFFFFHKKSFLFFFFFFSSRRRHTRCYRDWSSDVCSSDLWRQLPAYLERELAALREGVRQGYVVPAGNVRVVLTQLDAILALGPDNSPFADPARRDSTSVFRAAWHELMEREITPAVRGYRDYLATEYLSHARTTTALGALPQGAECYRALVRAYTTLDRDPKAVHELGLREMERVERDMRSIAERSFGTSDVHALLVRHRTDSQYTFRS